LPGIEIAGLPHLVPPQIAQLAVRGHPPGPGSGHRAVLEPDGAGVFTHQFVERDLGDAVDGVVGSERLPELLELQFVAEGDAVHLEVHESIVGHLDPTGEGPAVVAVGGEEEEQTVLREL
jgi:hypothetical protein